MSDSKKTKSELLKELQSLRSRIQQLESSRYDGKQHTGDEWEHTFNTIRDLIFITDKDGVIRRVNKALAKRLGTRSRDIIGRTCRDVFQCDHEGTEKCSLRNILKGVSIREHEAEIPILDMWVLAHVYAVYTPSQELDYIIHTYRDITDHKRLENQILQFTKTEAVARLAGGVAHEFNNLLTGIIGNLSLAQSQLSPDSEEYFFLERAYQSAERASELVKRLLAFSSKLKVTYNVVYLNDEIEKTVNMLQKTMDPRIKIVIQTDKKLWTVIADPIQIRSMLTVLIENASDAITECLEGLFRDECREKDSYTITITAENITIKEGYNKMHADARPGDYVVISIADNGPGMDEETQRHIFEPFFTTRDVVKGKGLGLAAVYGILKQYKGWINLSSEIGTGTTFKIYLPRAES